MSKRMKRDNSWNHALAVERDLVASTEMRGLVTQARSQGMDPRTFRRQHQRIVNQAVTRQGRGRA